MIHDIEGTQISKKQDGRNTYVIMKTIFPDYHHNGFVATHALGYTRYVMYTEVLHHISGPVGKVILENLYLIKVIKKRTILLLEVSRHTYNISYIFYSYGSRKKVFVKDSMSKRKKLPFLFMSLPWLSNELLRSINKLKQGIWCIIWLSDIYYIYIYYIYIYRLSSQWLSSQSSQWLCDNSGSCAHDVRDVHWASSLYIRTY